MTRARARTTSGPDFEQFLVFSTYATSSLLISSGVSQRSSTFGNDVSCFVVDFCWFFVDCCWFVVDFCGVLLFFYCFWLIFGWFFVDVQTLETLIFVYSPMRNLDFSNFYVDRFFEKLGPNLAPIWHPKPTKNRRKFINESSHEAGPFLDRISIGFGLQNHSKSTKNL